MKEKELQRRKKHFAHEKQLFINAMAEKGISIPVVTDTNVSLAVREVLKLVRPHDMLNCHKLRIGGANDGGYAMAEPGYGGVAYSFGISDRSPWDLAMAERNFKVYQYDGTIDQEPDKHPNIFFHRFNISSKPMDGIPCKNLKEILCENGHEKEEDIILQMDIEGGEWEFFTELEDRDILKFKQIIAEFHETGIWVHRYNILKKIMKTHVPIQVHYNNAAVPSYIQNGDFFYCDSLMEVSFVRRRDFETRICNDYFPTKLDSPNLPRRPEIPVGYFDLLLDENGLCSE